MHSSSTNDFVRYSQMLFLFLHWKSEHRMCFSNAHLKVVGVQVSHEQKWALDDSGHSDNVTFHFQTKLQQLAENWRYVVASLSTRHQYWLEMAHQVDSDAVVQCIAQVQSNGKEFCSTLNWTCSISQRWPLYEIHRVQSDRNDCIQWRKAPDIPKHLQRQCTAAGLSGWHSQQIAILLHCESKKQDTLLMSITLWNIKRFSKLLHC